jgi:hypothetical protein
MRTLYCGRGREDLRGVVRYLSRPEEAALREAPCARDEERREARASANAWRAERGYPAWPAYGRSGLAAGVGQFRFHDLRHTLASKLVMAGVDITTARELLGHGARAMTLRYAHLAPEHEAAAVARLVDEDAPGATQTLVHPHRCHGFAAPPKRRSSRSALSTSSAAYSTCPTVSGPCPRGLAMADQPRVRVVPNSTSHSVASAAPSSVHDVGT